MSKIRVSRTSATATLEKKKSKEWPIVVYVWAFGLALVSYLVARIVLNAYPHPYHWGTGIAGALFGIGIGWLWFRWRGDILEGGAFFFTESLPRLEGSFNVVY